MNTRQIMLVITNQRHGRLFEYLDEILLKKVLCKCIIDMPLIESDTNVAKYGIHFNFKNLSFIPLKFYDFGFLKNIVRDINEKTYVSFSPPNGIKRQGNEDKNKVDLIEAINNNKMGII